MYRVPTIILALGVAATAISAGIITQTATAAETGISVLMHQAKIVKLSRPADTIIIGNPEIADAVVQNSSTIVLTGKGFGVTNLVILDRDGEPIVDEQISVARQDALSVRVYRRAEVQTLSCTPKCEGAFKSAAETLSESELAR